MKKDIHFPPVEGVSIAIARDTLETAEIDWKVYIINNNAFALSNVLIASKGYGHQDGEEQKTSILRHLIEYIEPNGSEVIERIDPAVFHLCNEYWVSYYVDSKIHDKKYLFLPDSIVEENISYIPQIEKEGVLHE
jgi:hypothetical protein